MVSLADRHPDRSLVLRLTDERLADVGRGVIQGFEQRDAPRLGIVFELGLAEYFIDQEVVDRVGLGGLSAGGLGELPFRPPWP